MNLTHFATVVSLSAGTIITVAGAIATMRPVLRKASDFFDDWQGQPPRPGVPEVPGVMERIRRLDDGQLDISTRLRQVEAQVNPDSGSSMYDKVSTIAQVVTSQPRSPGGTP